MSKLRKSPRRPGLLTKAAFAICLLAAQQGAFAGTVDLKFNGFQFGSEIESIKTNVYSDSLTQVSAGGFNMGVTSSGGFLGGSSILAWCVDVAQTLSTSIRTYTTSDLGTSSIFGAFSSSATKVDNLQSLINEHYQDLFSSQTAKQSVLSAAMQLAIWEVVADESLNLASGNFKAQALSGTTTDAKDSADAYRIAADWLSNLKTTAAQGQYKIVVLNNGAYQDLITVSPLATPIPGAALLFASALGLGRVFKRRRSAAQAA